MSNVQLSSIKIDEKDYLKPFFVDYRMADEKSVYALDLFDSKINPDNYLSYFYPEREVIESRMYENVARPMLDVFLKYYHNEIKRKELENEINDVFKEQVKPYLNSLEIKLNKDDPWMVKNLPKEFNNYAKKVKKFLLNKKRDKDIELIHEFYDKKEKFEKEYDELDNINELFEEKPKHRKFKRARKMLKFLAIYGGLLLMNKFVRMVNAANPPMDYNSYVCKKVDADNDGKVDYYDIYYADIDVEKHFDYRDHSDYSGMQVSIDDIEQSPFMRVYIVYDENGNEIGLNADWDIDNSIDARLNVIEYKNFSYFKLHNNNFGDIFYDNATRNPAADYHNFILLSPDVELENNEIHVKSGMEYIYYGPYSALNLNDYHLHVQSEKDIQNSIDASNEEMLKIIKGMSFVALLSIGYSAFRKEKP